MKKIIYSFFLLAFSIVAFAQTGGISISNTGSLPDSSAALDVNFSNKGVLFPRLTTAQRNSIANPAQSLMIFNTNTNCFETFILGSWQNIFCGCGGPPATPGNISGSSTACVSQSGVVYTISADSGATSYTWIVPSGAIVTAGQGTTSATITFGSVSGNVTVVANNSCGSSGPSNLSVTLNSAPGTPGTISGSTNISSGQSGIIYSISPVSGATSYTWTSPSGATITSGQGTDSVIVDFGNNQGNMSVTASNSCGTSDASSLAITFCSGTITYNSNGTYESGNIQSFNVPSCATQITIEAWGAQGGNTVAFSGGAGADIKGTFSVTGGELINILIGQQGKNGSTGHGNCGGGGGGTFVTRSNGNPMLVAGGGGGAGISGSAPDGGQLGTSGSSGKGSNGMAGGTGGNAAPNVCGGCGSTNGAGFYSNSQAYGGSYGTAALAYVNGGTGSTSVSGYNGGFGVAGAGAFGAGGGGGYSGGGSGNYTSGTDDSSGGGGGSYNAGTNTVNQAGSRTGNGQVIITW